MTTCGTFQGPDSKDPYSFFMRRSPSGVLANFIGTGYYAGLQMNGGGVPATTQMFSSILYNNQDPGTDAGTNIWDPGYGAADTNVVTWFTTMADGGASNNAQTNPGIPNCATPTGSIQMAPAAAITANAATPPSLPDGGAGFFDTTATYIGAFKDTTACSRLTAGRARSSK
jgi:hypothetical protein